jgi:hypothetical protein
VALMVGVFIFRPTMLIYVLGVFAPAGAVLALESSGNRFVSLGCATMTFAAAGPVILAGLLDPTRNPVAEPDAETQDDVHRAGGQPNRM